jgi:hypothetical protein
MTRTAQQIHGDRVEARQRINNQPFNDQPPRDGRFAPGTLPPIEGLHSAIDVKPDSPFFKFWLRINDEATSKGHSEVGYGEARKRFDGGATPHGALTFADPKQASGVRAVRQPGMINGEPIWYGEYRVVTEDGVQWLKVANSNGGIISYTTAEYALNAATWMLVK